MSDNFILIQGRHINIKVDGIVSDNPPLGYVAVYPSDNSGTLELKAKDSAGTVFTFISADGTLTDGNIPSFNSDGQIEDSGLTIADVLNIPIEVTGSGTINLRTDGQFSAGFRKGEIYQIGSGITAITDGVNPDISVTQYDFFYIENTVVQASIDTATDILLQLNSNPNPTVETVQMDTSVSPPSHSEGLFYYDSTEKGFVLFNDITDSSLLVGGEGWRRIYNDTGSQIDNGDVVYLSGFDAVSGRPTVALANASSDTSLSTLGIATHDIADSSEGIITLWGDVKHLNTSSFSNGDTVYLDTSDGGLTITPPASPAYLVIMGNVVKSDATEGIINVAVNINNNNQSVIKVFDGSILEDHTTTISSNGTTITLSLEQDGGGDLSLFFDGAYTVFDSTPAATVNLTAGTDVSPQRNYVYIPKSTMTLTSSTSGWPSSGQFVRVADVVCQSAASVQTDGVMKHHAHTDHLADDQDMGHVSHINYWIRQQSATWLSGAQLTPTVGLLEFDVAVASGEMLQLHEHSIDSFDTSTGSDVYVVNNPTTAYNKVGDLTGELTDSEGVSLSGRKYSLVFWVSGNEGAGNDKLFCNLPSGSYTSTDDATNDVSNYANYSIPSEYIGTGVLLARITVSHSVSGGGTWTLLDDEDLRGVTNVGGSSGGTDPDAIHDNVAGEIHAVTEKTSPVYADEFLGEDSADSYNKKRIQIGNLPAFTGDSGAGGTKGYVPAPAAGDAAANKVLGAGGSWITVSGSGLGDFSGPASSTDNAIVRFDGTSGKNGQNSGLIISDNNKLTIPDNSTEGAFNVTERSSEPTTPSSGDMYLDDGTNTTSTNPGWRRYTGSVWEDIGATTSSPSFAIFDWVPTGAETDWTTDYSTWKNVPLDTSTLNNISGASLSTNQITLPAGTYEIHAEMGGASDTATSIMQMRFRNISDSSTEVAGLFRNGGSAEVPPATLMGVFTIATSKTLELQFWHTARYNPFYTDPSSGELKCAARILIKKY